jgi:hypothetical protein
MRSVRDIPYAVFLAGTAAIIGSVVALPRVLIAHNKWWVMLFPAVFSGAALINALWSLRAKGLNYGSTLGEFNALESRPRTRRADVKPTFGWLFYAVLIPMAVSVLLAFGWIAVNNHQHGQSIDSRIWIGFALGLALIAMACWGILRSRRSS